MANFTGTNADEIITPEFVSSTVTAIGGTQPSNAADVINGGAGNDIIDSGGGNDTVNGGTGNDVAHLGLGNDLFIWNPGDGSDIVKGDRGFDTLDFVGAGAGAGADENITISASGERALFFRNVGNVTMDLDGVERIQFEAKGGVDNIVVNDLSETDVKQVAIDLAAIPGSNVGDHQPDTVTVNGTAGNNNIKVSSDGASVVVEGLSAQVTIAGADPDTDTLIVKGGDGNDVINASALEGGQIKLVIDGGAGNNVLFGSQGNDTFVVTAGENGRDMIHNFQAHGAGTQGDVVELTGFSDHTFDQAVADGHISQQGNNVVIFDGAKVVATLQDVSLTSLHANDFLFT
jgi:Ca2+-binding RTX toxin-like protein